MPGWPTHSRYTTTKRLPHSSRFSTSGYHGPRSHVHPSQTSQTCCAKHHQCRGGPHTLDTPPRKGCPTRRDFRRVGTTDPDPMFTHHRHPKPVVLNITNAGVAHTLSIHHHEKAAPLVAIFDEWVPRTPDPMFTRHRHPKPVVLNITNAGVAHTLSRHHHEKAAPLVAIFDEWVPRTPIPCS